MGRPFKRGLVSVLLVASAAGVVVAPPAQASATATGTYRGVTPTRLLDTRTPNHAPIARNGTLPLTVTGAVVPADASAVVLTVTATSPVAGGFLTIYPSGASRPTASSLNFVARSTVPNLVVVRVGSDGKVKIYNGSSGGTDVLVDVSGYLVGTGAPSGQGAFGVLPAPRRVLDTRVGTGTAARRLPAHRALTVAVTGGGVPAGVSAAIVNLTAVLPTAGGFLAGYASGTLRRDSSNLNFVARRTVANLAVLPVGADGRVAIYNGSSGPMNVVADIAGYVLELDPVSAGGFGSLGQTRLLDTRHGVGAARRRLGAGAVLTLQVGGAAGVPLRDASAVVLNLTATGGSRSGHITVYAGGTAPTVSNVNYAPRQTVSNLVVAPVSSTGSVTIANGSSGTVDVVADVSGYVLKAAASVPRTSTGRYVRNLGGSFGDPSTRGDGCADARARSSLVVLDIGAQLNDGTGVILSATSRTASWAVLKAALNRYLKGFAACHTGGQATVAIATNNDADFQKNSATNRGAGWANKVVDALTVPSGVTIAGAVDFEPGFASTEKQAEQWEAAFLANTRRQLVFIGSADGCPTTFGVTGAACLNGWSQAQLATMAGASSRGRILALPQVYRRSQGIQWANIQRTSGYRLSFAGVMTQHATCPTVTSPGCNFVAYVPSAAWASLHHWLSAVQVSPSLPVVTDLRVSS